jgi:endoglucanase
MPEDDTKTLYLTATSYAATGDFAAVMASASRVLKDIDATRSATYLEAAKKSYNALATMEAKSYKNESSISTGEYPDDKLDDELAWAAIELFRATKTESYVNDYLNTYAKGSPSIGYGWDNVYGYAIYSYLKSGHESSNKASMLKLMKDEKTEFINRMNNNPVSSPIGSVYEWGSNMAVCNYAMCSILLNEIEAQDDTLDTVNRLLNYLLGINNTTYCYVTGFGDKSPVNPHHRPSQAQDQAVIGMLVGGPNSDFKNNGGDTIASTKLKDKNPDECYIDHANSWSTNEVTIYWNSPLIFILGYIQ